MYKLLQNRDLKNYQHFYVDNVKKIPLFFRPILLFRGFAIRIFYRCADNVKERPLHF